MLWSDLERLSSWGWDPWREFERMRKALERNVVPSSVEFPAVNIWIAAEEAVVTTELPGMDPKDIDISVVGKTVTLRGLRDSEKLGEGESYHRKERWQGKFTKTFTLPFNVDATKVNARFTKGVLTIALPRSEEEKPKKIEIASE